MKLALRLYITGRSDGSQRAIRNLRRLLEERYPDRYSLEVVDVLQKPQLAEDEKILATPTLVRRLPPPVRKILGDLGDRDKVLFGLDLVEAPSTEEGKKEGNE